jgi:topoisomerase-4 subunit B
MAENKYTEDSIKSLDWKEHIRLRPGMYIGKLGDGSASEDGIYILLKEVIDNSIDEFVMGNGQKIEINISEQGQVAVRDYGRGIPLGKLKDCASKINTGGKYDSEAFKKSVGLNGVGIKAVNALSNYFKIEAFRDGKKRAIEFSEGNLVSEDASDQKSDQPNGTSILFNPDPKLFNNFNYRLEFVENMVRYYSYLNRGLNVLLNGRKFKSKGGLFDLLTDEITEEIQYPIIHLSGEDIEIAFTHTSQYGEDYFSFVNGQNTTQHGTHVAAFKESIVKTIRDFYKKSYEAVDVRSSIIACSKR